MDSTAFDKRLLIDSFNLAPALRSLHLSRLLNLHARKAFLSRSNSIKKTRRVTTQPSAEVVSDAVGLQPISSEDDQVTESNVTPQSCPLTVVKKTPEISPTKTSTSRLKITPDATADQDGNESSSSRTSVRSKRQTLFYGSPIRHAFKGVSEASTPGFSGGLTVPVSPAELNLSLSPRKRMKVFKKNKKQLQKRRPS